jgi:uncharacterized protein YukE
MTGVEGFAASGAGVAAMQQSYVSLKAAVDGGQVMIKPDAATNAAKACRDKRDRFVDFQTRAQGLAQRVQGINMGGCDEGNSLRKTFHDKAQGGHNSAYDLFGQAAEIMENMAKTYEAAGKMYHETDQGNAQAFKGKM